MIRVRARRNPFRFAILPGAIVATLLTASTLFGHDFWIIPDAFSIPTDTVLRLSGQSGTRFPTSRSAVPAAQIVDARIVGASGQTKIIDFSVQGTSLRLSHRPTAAGQYLVVVGLQPRTMKSTASALLTSLRGEGAADEANRMERENTWAGSDSVTTEWRSYAATIVQVGQAGPRAYTLSAGQAVEFAPVSDPARLQVGDTLHVRIIGKGKPLANTGLYAGSSLDTTAGAPAPVALHLMTGPDGVAHIPLTKPGAWNLRAAYVSRHTGGTRNEWDVSRTTYVFLVQDKK